MRHCAYCLAGLACVAARQRDATTAGRLWALAERTEHEIGFLILGAERRRYEEILTADVRDDERYRAGAAAAADLDPLIVAAEIVGT
jgi:hypothetical protein